jgi:predicted nucleotidyltransferase
MALAARDPAPKDGPERAPEERAMAGVLQLAVDALERARVGYVLIGGVGSASLGRPRWTYDIDVLVSPIDADRALDALGDADFETDRTNEQWIFKAKKDDIVVDIIFRTVGDIYLDDELLARARPATFLGVTAPVAAPEDQIVIKAIAHDEQSARHWNDALSLIASCELDWEYLIERASRGPRRVLSLLIYAQSSDLVVPPWVIERLFRQIYAEESDVPTSRT